MTKEKLLIVGCGYIGEALALSCQIQYDIYTIRRTAQSDASPWHTLALDVSKPFELPYSHSFEYVVYCVSAGSSNKEAYESAYVTGSLNTLAALEKLPSRPKRCLFLSSTSVYPSTNGAWIDESSDLAPQHFRATTMITAEKVWLQSNLAASVLRLGGIYGPKRDRLLREVIDGSVVTTPQDNMIWSNRIHRDDAVGTIKHLLNQEKRQEIFNVVDSLPATRTEIITYLSTLTGKKIKSPQVNASPSPRTTNKKVCNQRLLNSGYKFIFPSYKEGFRSLFENTKVHCGSSVNLL